MKDLLPVRVTISLSVLTSSLFITGIMPLTGQLNNNVAGLGRLALMVLFLFAAGLCAHHSQS